MFTANFRDSRRLAGTRVFSRPTFPSGWPLLTLDYLFVTSDLDVSRYQVPKTEITRVASDHLPVIVDIERRPFWISDQTLEGRSANLDSRTS